MSSPHDHAATVLEPGGRASGGRKGHAHWRGFALLLLTGCGGLGGEPHHEPFHPPPRTPPVPPHGNGHTLVARAPQLAQLERSGRATVAGPGDLTGDAVDDFIVADREAGRLDLYAGSAGALVVAQTIPIEGGLQPCRIAPGGDPVGDGLRHVLVQVGQDCDEEDTVVLLYAQGADGLEPSPLWQAVAAEDIQLVGRELSVGDIDGDGLDDLVIAQENLADRITYGGRLQAAVYQGGADGLAEAPTWVRPVQRRGQHDGSGASAGGDFNADGYADLIVSDLSTRGSCYTPFASAQAYSGSATGPTPDPTWSMAMGGLGLDARLTGDVDGDGFDDALVSTTCGGLPLKGGAVVVVPGSPDGLTEPTWEVRDSYREAYFAYDFDGADVDGDGHLDILAATTEYQTVDQAHSRGDQKRGMGFVWLGAEGGFGICRPAVDDAMRPWPESYLRAPEAGAGIRAIGDVNADGRADIAVYGASTYIFTDVMFDTECGRG